MKIWLDPPDVTVPDDLREWVGGHPLVAQMLVRRGLTTLAAARAFLDPQAYTPADPTELPDLERAAERLESAIRRGERICVWGDFDVDGQTSTTVLVSALRDLGGTVTYHIPVRATESHGVNVPNLARVIDAGAQVILTCDTGSDAHEAAAYAQSQGVELLITDHHDLPPELPPAYALVNPHRLAPGHPLAALPGVGVAYELALALYRRAGREAEAARLLDLVALGIVVDVAEQVGDTRYLLQVGLEALRNTSRQGLLAVLALNNLTAAQLTTEHIGFMLGPRLNALGRLGDANASVDFLTTDDVQRARVLAMQLEGLNTERKRLCDSVLQGAIAQIEHNPRLLEYGALVLADADWPAGVVGIVASRLAEQYHRPVVLITTPEGEVGRGSARSVAGCNITEAIATQSAVLERFGGHPQAAGLAIRPEQIPAFRRGLSKAVEAQLGKDVPPPRLQVDGYVALGELSLALVEDLERLSPFGQGNPPLMLATRGLKLQSHSTLGRDGDHLQVIIEDETGATQRVLWWHGSGSELPEGRFDLAYTARVNVFRGERQLQVEWVDARALEVPVVSLPVTVLPELVDYRREPHPLTLLKPLLARGDVQVWAEMQAEVAGRGRHQLEPGAELVVWTLPPGPDVWREALERVTPQRVVLFAHDPHLDALEPFLKRLAGLVKYALANTAGRARIETLAAALAHREATLRKGLAWLEARGYVTIEGISEGEYLFAPGRGEVREDAVRLTVELKALLEETAAYRKHFARAEAGALWAGEKRKSD